MFPYRVKYTESESDIQNNNLLYKRPPISKIISKKKYCSNMFKIKKVQALHNFSLYYI